MYIYIYTHTDSYNPLGLIPFSLGPRWSLRPLDPRAHTGAGGSGGSGGGAGALEPGDAGGSHGGTLQEVGAGGHGMMWDGMGWMGYDGIFAAKKTFTKNANWKITHLEVNQLGHFQLRTVKLPEGIFLGPDFLQMFKVGWQYSVLQRFLEKKVEHPNTKGGTSEYCTLW